MSTTSTPNLSLVKPTLGTGEHADVSVINENMDKIDAAVGGNSVITGEDCGTLVSPHTWRNAAANTIVKKCNVCQVNVGVQLGEQAPAGTGTSLFTLPSGYRPAIVTLAPVQVATNAVYQIEADGRVLVFPGTALPSGTILWLRTSFLV